MEEERIYGYLRCAYCGQVFGANRPSRALYCSPQHGSMFRKDGPNEALWLIANDTLEKAGISNDAETAEIMPKAEELELSGFRAMEKVRDHLTLLSISEREKTGTLLKMVYRNWVQKAGLWTQWLPLKLLRDSYGFTAQVPHGVQYLAMGEMAIEVNNDGYWIRFKPLELLSEQEFSNVRRNL